MANNENNNGLYFIVGALFVAVAVLGFFLMASQATENGDVTEIITTEPAGGEESSEFNLNITEDGFSAETSTEEN